MPRYLLLHSVGSTNTYLKGIAATVPAGTVVHTPCQREGRGQPGNSWEAEPGKNLTFSLLLKPDAFDARHQFALSEATALSVADAAARCCPEASVTVKWPNDVYAGDSKIAGILIEHALVGNQLQYSIVGVGMNVNQTIFTSGAPNPASLAQLAGHEFDLDSLLHDLCERIEAACALAATPDGRQRLHRQYLARLYRHDGQPHPFALPVGTQFAATVVDVRPDGTLRLRHADDGRIRDYAFKEVKHVVGSNTL